MDEGASEMSLDRPSGRLAGKVAVVTGAASGMGAAIARGFLQEGACVVAADVNVVAPSSIAVDSSHETALLTLVHDVSSPESWTNLAAAAIERFSGVDILINAAGIYGPSQNKGIEAVELEVWQQVLSVNLSGSFFGMQTLVPLMKKRGGGSIVNIASISGVIGNAKASAYTASKGGVRALGKGAAVELAPFNIRVNTIHPGYTETNMIANHLKNDAIRNHLVGSTPLGRLGTPEDIAYAALYLASDEASFVTGAELAVDGGNTAI